MSFAVYCQVTACAGGYPLPQGAQSKKHISLNKKKKLFGATWGAAKSGPVGPKGSPGPPGPPGMVVEEKQEKKMKIRKRKKWWQLYPQGTAEGDQEQKFFKVIARNPKYKFRSVAQISKETGLSKERVEEIIEKYAKISIVIQNPKNAEQWGYWERVPKEYLEEEIMSISGKDKKKRVDQELDDDIII